MAEKFNRLKFHDTFINDGTIEVDMNSEYMSLFQINNPTTIHTVSSSDKSRPDIISFIKYNSTQYWWIIMMVNNIDDIWNDLDVGDDLIIPSIRDIEDFFIRVKNYKRKTNK